MCESGTEIIVRSGKSVIVTSKNSSGGISDITAGKDLPNGELITNNLYQFKNNKLDKITEILKIRKQQIKQFDEIIKSQFVEMFENKNIEKKTLQDITIKITDGSHNPPNGIDEN